MSNKSTESRCTEFKSLVQGQINVLELQHSRATSSFDKNFHTFLKTLMSDVENIDETKVNNLAIWYSVTVLTLQCIHEFESNPAAFSAKALILLELIANLPKIPEYKPTLIQPKEIAEKLKTYRNSVLMPYVDSRGKVIANSQINTLQQSLDEIIILVQNLDSQASTLLASTVLTIIWEMLHVVNTSFSDTEFSDFEKTGANAANEIDGLVKDFQEGFSDFETPQVIGGLLTFLLSHQESET